jgi:hypothetical protein
VSLIQMLAALLLVAGSVLVVGMLWLLDTASTAVASGPRTRETDELANDDASDLRQAA